MMCWRRKAASALPSCFFFAHLRRHCASGPPPRGVGRPSRRRRAEFRSSQASRKRRVVHLPHAEVALVRGDRLGGDLRQRRKILHLEVAHADRARQALLLHGLEGLPHLGGLRRRRADVMQQHQVDVARVELLQVRRDVVLRHRGVHRLDPAVPVVAGDLGRDEHLLAAEPARFDARWDLALRAVVPRRVYPSAGTHQVCPLRPCAHTHAPGALGGGRQAREMGSAAVAVQPSVCAVMRSCAQLVPRPHPTPSPITSSGSLPPPGNVLYGIEADAMPLSASESMVATFRVISSWPGASTSAPGSWIC
jgi:hypothetical protein